MCVGQCVQVIVLASILVSVMVRLSWSVFVGQHESMCLVKCVCWIVCVS